MYGAERENIEYLRVLTPQKFIFNETCDIIAGCICVVLTYPFTSPCAVSLALGGRILMKDRTLDDELLVFLLLLLFVDMISLFLFVES